MKREHSSERSLLRDQMKAWRIIALKITAISKCNVEKFVAHFAVVKVKFFN